MFNLSSSIQTLTVGIGVAPILHKASCVSVKTLLADFTADRELHPALKTSYSNVLNNYNRLQKYCN